MSQGSRGWFAIRVIWRNRDMSTDVGILERFPRNACLLWISRSRPPLYPL